MNKETRYIHKKLYLYTQRSANAYKIFTEIFKKIGQDLPFEYINRYQKKMTTEIEQSNKDSYSLLILIIFDRL
jgi:hypothetical protein